MALDRSVLSADDMLRLLDERYGIGQVQRVVELPEGDSHCYRISCPGGEYVLGDVRRWHEPPRPRAQAPPLPGIGVRSCSLVSGDERYLCQAQLDAYDLRMMPQLYICQLIASNYFAQYYRADPLGKAAAMDVASWSTDLCRWLVTNGTQLSEILVRAL